MALVKRKSLKKGDENLIKNVLQSRGLVSAIFAKAKPKCPTIIRSAASCFLQLKQQPIKFQVMNMFDLSNMGNVTNVNFFIILK